MNMKLRPLLIAILSLLTVNAMCQIKVDESNIINQLFGLYKYPALDIHKYYEQHHFKLADVKKATMGKNELFVRRYDNPATTDHFVLNDIGGSVFAVSYMTYSEKKYTYALRQIIMQGFVKVAPQQPMEGSTIYRKPGSYDQVLVLIKDVNQKTVYTFQVNNLYQASQLLKL